MASVIGPKRMATHPLRSQYASYSHSEAVQPKRVRDFIRPGFAGRRNVRIRACPPEGTSEFAPFRHAQFPPTTPNHRSVMNRFVFSAARELFAIEQLCLHNGELGEGSMDEMELAKVAVGRALTTPSAPASRNADRAACVCNWPTVSRRRPSASLGVIGFVGIPGNLTRTYIRFKGSRPEVTNSAHFRALDVTFGRSVPPTEENR